MDVKQDFKKSDMNWMKHVYHSFDLMNTEAIAVHSDCCNDVQLVFMVMFLQTDMYTIHSVHIQ